MIRTVKPWRCIWPKELAQRGIAYLHIAEPDWAGGQPLSPEFRRDLRLAFSGRLIYCGGYTAEKAEAVIAAGIADAIAALAAHSSAIQTCRNASCKTPR